jgi:hypothetical protein
MRRAFTKFPMALGSVINLDPSLISSHYSYNEIAFLMIRCNNRIVQCASDPYLVKYSGQYTGILTSFCPNFVHFARLNPRAYIAELDQFEFPPPVDGVTAIWLPRLALPTLSALAEFDNERVAICARRIIETFTPAIRDKCFQEGVPPDDVRIAKKLVAPLGQLGNLVGIDPAAALIQIVLSIEDPKLFLDIAPTIEHHGCPLLIIIWPELLKRKDCLLQELSDLLLRFDGTLKNIAIFQNLPGVDPAAWAELQAKNATVTAVKTRRRLFRNFVASLHCE